MRKQIGYAVAVLAVVTVAYYLGTEHGGIQGSGEKHTPLALTVVSEELSVEIGMESQQALGEVSPELGLESQAVSGKVSLEVGSEPQPVVGEVSPELGLEPQPIVGEVSPELGLEPQPVVGALAPEVGLEPQPVVGEVSPELGLEPQPVVGELAPEVGLEPHPIVGELAPEVGPEMLSVAGELTPAVGPESPQAGAEHSLDERLPDVQRPTVDEQVSELLQLGEQALAKNYLTTPEESSAYHYYLQVLELAPDNRDGAAGLQGIARRYGLMAVSMMETQRYRIAQVFISRGLAVVEGYPGLVELQGELDTQLAAAETVDPVQLEEPAPPAKGLFGVLKRFFRGQTDDPFPG